MYPIHHSTLKIEQAERQADAALLRLAAATAGTARRRWWRRTRIEAVATPGPVPAPMPTNPTPAPAPAPAVAAEGDRVLVGR